MVGEGLTISWPEQVRLSLFLFDLNYINLLHNPVRLSQCHNNLLIMQYIINFMKIIKLIEAYFCDFSPQISLVRWPMLAHQMAMLNQQMTMFANQMAMLTNHLIMLPQPFFHNQKEANLAAASSLQYNCFDLLWHYYSIHLKSYRSLCKHPSVD